MKAESSDKFAPSVEEMDMTRQAGEAAVLVSWSEKARLNMTTSEVRTEALKH